MAALVDTNILVYRFDSRFADNQKIATGILRRGILEDSVRLPHQAIVEFIAAVTRPIRGHVILKQADALREAEEFLKQFTVLYPNEAILRHAIRGCAAYQLNWFDAHPLVIRRTLRPAGKIYRGSSARSALWHSPRSKPVYRCTLARSSQYCLRIPICDVLSHMKPASCLLLAAALPLCAQVKITQQPDRISIDIGVPVFSPGVVL